MFAGLILSTQKSNAHIFKKWPIRCLYVNLRRRNSKTFKRTYTTYTNLYHKRVTYILLILFLSSDRVLN